MGTMGSDLTLLPFGSTLDIAVRFFSHTILNLERRRELWPLIDEIEERFGRDVPHGFTSFLGRQDNGEHGYGDTMRTPYDDNLKYVEARHLKPLKDHSLVQDNYLNRAAWAYLEQLPDDLPIALYWH